MGKPNPCMQSEGLVLSKGTNIVSLHNSLGFSFSSFKDDSFGEVQIEILVKVHTQMKTE